jgi:hypothetical protein
MAHPRRASRDPRKGATLAAPQSRVRGGVGAKRRVGVAQQVRQHAQREAGLGW